MVALNQSSDGWTCAALVQPFCFQLKPISHCLTLFTSMMSAFAHRFYASDTTTNEPKGHLEPEAQADRAQGGAAGVPSHAAPTVAPLSHPTIASAAALPRPSGSAGSLYTHLRGNGYAFRFHLWLYQCWSQRARVGATEIESGYIRGHHLHPVRSGRTKPYSLVFEQWRIRAADVFH